MGRSGGQMLIFAEFKWELKLSNTKFVRMRYLSRDFPQRMYSCCYYPVLCIYLCRMFSTCIAFSPDRAADQDLVSKPKGQGPKKGERHRTPHKHGRDQPAFHQNRGPERVRCVLLAIPESRGRTVKSGGAHKGGRPPLSKGFTCNKP